MSNKIKMSVVLSACFAASIFTTSCYRDVTVPELAPEVNTEISFSADIIPIYNSECTSCHSSGGTAPDLTVSSAYSSSLNYVNTGSPENSELYQRLAGLGAKPVMPPGGANQANAATVLAWIKQGAKNN